MGHPAIFAQPRDVRLNAAGGPPQRRSAPADAVNRPIESPLRGAGETRARDSARA